VLRPLCLLLFTVAAVNQAIRQSVSQSFTHWQNTLRIRYVTNVVVVHLACVFYFCPLLRGCMLLLLHTPSHTHTHTHTRTHLTCICAYAYVYLCLNVSDSFMVICMHLCCVNADENVSFEATMLGSSNKEQTVNNNI